jgi:flavodoxin
MLVYCEEVKMQKPVFASYRTPIGLIEWTAGLFGSAGDRVAAKIRCWKPSAVISLSSYLARHSDDRSVGSMLID